MKNSQIIWMIPGQGQSAPHFLTPWIERFSEIAERVEWASDNLHLSFMSLQKEPDTFQKSALTQTLWAILILGFRDVLHKYVPHTPVAYIGHSLGETIALILAQAWTDEEGLQTIYNRGRAMDACSISGGLSVYLGPQLPLLLESWSRGEWPSNVYPANYNSPKQLVVSSTDEGLQQFEQWIKTHKWGVVKRLNVSKPAHSPLMKESVPLWENSLTKDVYDISVPIAANHDGLLYEKQFPKHLLIQQLTHGVKWMDGIHTLKQRFPEGLFLEVGPKKLLGSLVDDITGKKVPVKTFEEFETLI